MPASAAIVPGELVSNKRPPSPANKLPMPPSPIASLPSFLFCISPIAEAMPPSANLFSNLIPVSIGLLYIERFGFISYVTSLPLADSLVFFNISFKAISFKISSNSFPLEASLRTSVIPSLNIIKTNLLFQQRLLQPQLFVLVDLVD